MAKKRSSKLAANMVAGLREFAAALNDQAAFAELRKTTVARTKQGVETMATAKDTGGLSKGRRVGKKRAPIKPKKKPSPRDEFAARLRELCADRTTTELGKLLKVSPNTVGKWLKGERVPDLELWPDIATALGLKRWTDLVPR